MSAASRAKSPRTAILVAYGAGLCQGLAFVLIPALGNLLKSAPFSFSNVTYGALFLPETLGAIGSAFIAGRIAKRFGLIGLFRIGGLANVVALGWLLIGARTAGTTFAFPALLLETAFLGVGFGLTLAAINDAATLLFPAGASASVTVLNAVIGGGTAISPVILAVFAAHGFWWAWPLLILFGFVGAMLGSGALRRVVIADATAHAPVTRIPARLWRYAAVVVIYAICEGTFGSWASIFVHTDRGGTVAQGALALSAFWGAMTLARVGFGAVTKWLVPNRIYIFSPVAIALVFVLIPMSRGAGELIALFALAGIACSYFFPFSMAFAIEENSAQAASASGLLVAALMLGEGIGSYALGPLQGARLMSLSAIYRTSALWGVLLFVGAWSLMKTRKRIATASAPASAKT